MTSMITVRLGTAIRGAFSLTSAVRSSTVQCRHMQILSSDQPSTTKMCTTFISARGISQSPVLMKKARGGAKKPVVEEEEEEEEKDKNEDDEPETEEESDDGRIVDVAVPSLRVDNVTKAAFNLARQKTEDLLYGGKIRVDGQVVVKKAASIHIGMTIDLLLDAVPDERLQTVKRLVILKLHDKSDSHGRFIVTVKKWAALVVDDYAAKK